MSSTPASPGTPHAAGAFRLVIMALPAGQRRPRGGAGGNLTDIETDQPRAGFPSQPSSRTAQPASQIDKKPVLRQPEPGRRPLKRPARARSGDVDSLRILRAQSLTMKVMDEAVTRDRRVDAVVLRGTRRLDLVQPGRGKDIVIPNGPWRLSGGTVTWKYSCPLHAFQLPWLT